MARRSDWTRRTFLAAAPAATAAIAAMPARAETKGDFKIGIIGSMSGPAAAFGREYVEGLLAYVKAWNARGGFRGRKIVTNVFDDETSPVNAVNGFRRHVADPKTMLVWAAVGSQTALGIKAIASEYKVPVVSGGGVDELGIPADPWFFKVSQGQTDLTTRFIAALKERGVKTLATLNATDAVGQADAKKVREMATAAGIKIVVAESFGTSDTNFNAQLVRIRNSKADLFWDQATGNPAILVFKQAKQLGIAMPMVVSFAAINRAFFAGIGGPDKAEGILAVIPLGAVAGGIPRS
jgi:branched-chain amino acid transport system substrate-binding protein